MGQRIGKIKSNDIELIVWKNGDYYSFQIQKTYFNSREGEWKKADSVFANDLEDVIQVCLKAKAWLEKKGIEVKNLPKETALASMTVKKVLNDLGIKESNDLRTKTHK